MIEIEKVRDFAKLIYAQPLPEHIIYHNWAHTKQVDREGVCIATGEGFGDYDLIRLRSAIYMHDIGNIVARDGHEEGGVRIASQVLPLFGASDEDLLIIQGLVMATKLPQNPTTPLEEVICDADLSLMGCEDWLEEIDKYRRELKIEDLRKWHEEQVKFLGSHNWFTKTARERYDKQKKANIEKAKRKLELLGASPN